MPAKKTDYRERILIQFYSHALSPVLKVKSGEIRFSFSVITEKEKRRFSSWSKKQKILRSKRLQKPTRLTKKRDEEKKNKLTPTPNVKILQSFRKLGEPGRRS